MLISIVMKDKSIIVIGGGLAGLSAGCYALMNGFSVRIFEHGASSGGLCTSWTRKGYIIDGCIHWLIGHRPGTRLYEIYKELGAVQENTFLDAKSYMNFIDEATGLRFDVTSDFEDVKRRLIELAPEDKALIEDVMRAAEALKDLPMAEKPMEVQGRIEKLITMWRSRGIILKAIKYGMPAKEFAARAKNRHLQRILGGLFVEDMCMFFSLFMLGYLFTNQLGHLIGGSSEFARPIEKKYRSLGGEISFNSTVEEIIVEGGSAVGVRLRDGSVHRADIVISACDLHSTLNRMLGGKYTSPRMRAMFEGWKMFNPILIASFGLKGRLPEYPPANVLILKEPLMAGGKAADVLEVRDFSYDPVISADGRRVVQALVETDYDYWAELRKEPERYKKAKEDFAAETLKRLECLYPGISGMVEMTDVATPYTFVRYTRNYRGAFEGWIMSRRSLAKPVEKTLPGLGNFYLAGQWVEPGGGVPTAILSGRGVIQIICRDKGVKFAVSP